VFYCVANMPGAVPNTSTQALTNATLPYVLAVADAGWREACRRDPALALALNTTAGSVVSEPVAAAHGLTALPLKRALEAETPADLLPPQQAGGVRDQVEPEHVEPGAR
jgi:alanine dehydrogenase